MRRRAGEGWVAKKAKAVLHPFLHPERLPPRRGRLRACIAAFSASIYPRCRAARSA